MIFKKRDKSNWDGIEKAAVMGTNFVAHTIVGLGVGYYFDKWFHTAPWGLLFWLIMGIVAGFRHMYLDAMKVSKAQDVPQAATSAAKGDQKVGQAAEADAQVGQAAEADPKVGQAKARPGGGTGGGDA